MEKMTQILEKLIDRTQEGKIIWHTTADPDGFLATLDTLGVVVSYLGKQSFASNERYKVQILNSEGRTAEVIETKDEYGPIEPERIATLGQDQAMSRLFTLARRSALDTDSTLEELAKQLDAIA